MTTEPSLKGSVLTDLVDDLNKLVADGELPRERLERRLTPADLAVLEAPIVVSHFYPVEFYARTAELLRDTVGGGRNEYLRERGFKRGQKLIDAGLYQQMEYASRAKVIGQDTPEKRFEAYGRDLKLFVTLSRSILNFTRWTPEVDPSNAGRHRILVDEAGAYPDALAWATEGLIDSMAASHGLSDMWSHKRTHRDQIVFRMTRSL